MFSLSYSSSHERVFLALFGYLAAGILAPSPMRDVGECSTHACVCGGVGGGGGGCMGERVQHACVFLAVSVVCMYYALPLVMLCLCNHQRTPYHFTLSWSSFLAQYWIPGLKPAFL